MHKQKLKFEWASGKPGADTGTCEVDIPDTDAAFLLAHIKAWEGRHCFFIDKITFDENGRTNERAVDCGFETTARKSRLAAQRALRRHLANVLEVVSEVRVTR